MCMRYSLIPVWFTCSRLNSLHWLDQLGKISKFLQEGVDRGLKVYQQEWSPGGVICVRDFVSSCQVCPYELNFGG